MKRIVNLSVCLFVAGLSPLLVASSQDHTPAPPQEASVTVDFARPVTVSSMTGFVHGMSRSSPLDELIAPLQPKLWRSGQLSKDIYARATRFGARVTVVASDIWGYQESKAPYRMFPAYEMRMKEIARTSAGKPVIFDIWNEPDGKEFWHGSVEQFLETFKRAHDAIRSVRADAVIAGPSMSFYHRDTLETFLDYCLANRIRLDVLTWHEFRDGARIPDIKSSLERARRDFLDDPKYKSVGIREIHINEAINERTQFKLASTMAVFDQLERGKADASARACWNESNGKNNCWNNTLEGLLSPDTRQPRAVWWAYKAYADGVPGRVSSTSDDERVVVLASGATPQSPRSSQNQVVIGAHPTSAVLAGADRPVKSRITLRHIGALLELKGATAVTMEISSIPNSGERALPSLPAPRMRQLPVQDDSVQLEMSLAPESIYVLKLRRP